MNREQLKVELALMEVNPNEYSLYSELKADSIIIFENYSKWEVFYLDERGNRDNLVIFENENDACIYVLNLFKEAKNIERTFGIKT